MAKNPPAMQGKPRFNPGSGGGGDGLLGEGMAAHCSVLAWKIPWTAEPGRLRPMGSQRVGQD